jgi:hypothetical protein
LVCILDILSVALSAIVAVSIGISLIVVSDMGNYFDVITLWLSDPSAGSTWSLMGQQDKKREKESKKNRSRLHLLLKRSVLMINLLISSLKKWKVLSWDWGGFPFVISLRVQRFRILILILLIPLIFLRILFDSLLGWKRSHWGSRVNQSGRGKTTQQLLTTSTTVDTGNSIHRRDGRAGQRGAPSKWFVVPLPLSLPQWLSGEPPQDPRENRPGVGIVTNYSNMRSHRWESAHHSLLRSSWANKILFALKGWSEFSDFSSTLQYPHNESE